MDQDKDVNLSTANNTGQKLATRALSALSLFPCAAFTVAINFGETDLDLQRNRKAPFHKNLHSPKKKKNRNIKI